MGLCFWSISKKLGMCLILAIPTSRHAALHEKMFLRAVLAEFRRSGIEETTFKMVVQQLNILDRAEGDWLLATDTLQIYQR